MQLCTISGRTRRTSKLFAVVLILGINLTPLSPVFATFGDGTPTIPNPNVFTESDLPKIDGATGAFTQRITLDIPPGRSGLQPDVTLDYNSQRTQDSIVGYGWQLSIPFIQRLNKTGSQNLYSGEYFSSSIDGELFSLATSTPATTSPTILDSLPVTNRQSSVSVTSDSFSYTVPAGGTNKLLVVLLAMGADKSASLSATQNGASLTCQKISGSITRAYHFYCYLASPASGTFSISWSGGTVFQYSIFTLQNAAQSFPIDVSNVNDLTTTGTSLSTNVTTTQGNDLLLDNDIGTGGSVTYSFGTGQTGIFGGSVSDVLGRNTASYKSAASSAGTETMTRTYSPNDNNDDLVVVAVKAAPIIYTASSTYYAARVDSGTDNSYSFANNTWTVYDKHGTRYLYGSSDSGRQYDTGTGTSTNTYKWYLQEVRDTNGNYIKYTYNRDSNELYPYQIIYTGNGASDGPAVVTFATSTRPDTRISFAPDFKITTNYRISEIDASFNGKVVRKYMLSYGPGVNGKRSLLASVQQQGYDDNNNFISLPATTFTYASSSSQFYTPNGVTSAAYQIADTNGNGINDRNEFYYTGCVNGVCTTGLSIYMDSSNYVNSYSPPGFWASRPGDYPNEHGTRYVDVNGDGKPDVVNGWNDNITPAYSNYSIYLNTYSTSTGIGWVATTSSSSIPTFAINNGYGVITGGILGDLNGDGLPDYSTSLPGWISAISYFGNGSGWDSAPGGMYTPPKDFPVYSPSPYASQLIDVNGDGLDDWVYSDGTDTYVLLNTGTGWESTAEPQWTIATSTLYYVPGSNPANYKDRGIRFFDINGDGLPDFIQSSNLQDTWGCGVSSYGYKGNIQNILLNTGNGWATSTAYTLPSPILSGYTLSGCSWVGPSASEYGNWIGNGQMLQSVMTGVTYPKGGSASIMYSYSTAGNNPELPVSLLVASAVGLYDGLGNAATTTYQYAGGKMYLASGVRDRKFAGFAIASTTYPELDRRHVLQPRSWH